MHTNSFRRVVRRHTAGAALVVGGALVACGPAAPPGARGAAARGRCPAAAPAGQAEWERTLASAREEGKVVVAGPRRGLS